MRWLVVLLAVVACKSPFSISVDRSGEGVVTSVPPGIDCGTACEMDVEGGIVTLTASPAFSSRFPGWGLPGCQDDAPCRFQLIEDRQVSVRFEPVPVRFDVELSGTGSGTVKARVLDVDAFTCSTTCGGDFVRGTVIVLTVTPNANSRFVRWTTGPCGTTDGSCTVVVDGAMTVGLELEKIGGISVTKYGDGTVGSSPPAINCGPICGAAFPLGTVVTLTASPAPGRVFTKWLGACSGTDVNCTVTVDDLIAVGAEFNLMPPAMTCTTTVTQNESGAAFSARLATVGAMICLAPGVIVSGPVDFSAANTAIAGATGARIDGTIRTNGYDGLRLLDLTVNGMVYVENTSMSITRCTITQTASDAALYTTGTASVGVHESVLTATTHEAVVTAFFGAGIGVWDSTIRAAKFGVIVGGPGAPSNARFENNTFRRIAGSAMDSSPLHSNRMDNTILSTMPNTFCNEGTATTDAQFVMPAIGGSTNPAWSFYSVAHVFLGDC